MEVCAGSQGAGQDGACAENRLGNGAKDKAERVHPVENGTEKHADKGTD